MKRWEAENLGRMLLEMMGRKWRLRVWEKDDGLWTYGAESKDGWWLLSPEFSDGELLGYWAYLRGEPGVGMWFRWAEFAHDPYRALISTKIAVEAELHVCAEIARKSARSLRAALNRRDDPEQPYAMGMS